jgi:hypothetical protein
MRARPRCHTLVFALQQDEERRLRSTPAQLAVGGRNEIGLVVGRAAARDRRLTVNSRCLRVSRNEFVRAACRDPSSEQDAIVSRCCVPFPKGLSRRATQAERFFANRHLGLGVAAFSRPLRRPPPTGRRTISRTEMSPRRADQSITIQPYDPDWPSLYEQEREVLRVANRGADKKWRRQ